MNVSVLSVVDWQNVVNVIPCLCRSIIWLVAIVFLLKVLRPIIELCIKNNHESKMKKKAFEMERYWFQQNNVERDFQVELDKKIKEKEDEIKKAIENQSKEEIKKKTLEFELEWFKNILQEISKLKYDINESCHSNKK